MPKKISQNCILDPDWQTVSQSFTQSVSRSVSWSFRQSLIYISVRINGIFNPVVCLIWSSLKNSPNHFFISFLIVILFTSLTASCSQCYMYITACHYIVFRNVMQPVIQSISHLIINFYKKFAVLSHCSWVIKKEGYMK